MLLFQTPKAKTPSFPTGFAFPFPRLAAGRDADMRRRVVEDYFVRGPLREDLGASAWPQALRRWQPGCLWIFVFEQGQEPL